MRDDLDKRQELKGAFTPREEWEHFKAMTPREKLRYLAPVLLILAGWPILILAVVVFFRALVSRAEGAVLFLFLSGVWMGTVVTWLVQNRRRQREAEEYHRDLQELATALKARGAFGEHVAAGEAGCAELNASQVGQHGSQTQSTYPVAHATSELSGNATPEQLARSSASSAPDAVLTAAAPRFSTLSLDELSERLVGVDDPLSELRLIEADVHEREKAWEGRGLWSGGRAKARRDRLAARAQGIAGPTLPTGPDPDPEQTPIPSGIELFLAHRLRDSGLFDDELELPHVRIVRPHSSGMFYLRVEQPHTSYAAMLCLLRIEAALNAVRFAWNYHDDRSALSERDIVCFMQRLSSSIVAQAEPIDAGLQTAPSHSLEGSSRGATLAVGMGATSADSSADGDTAAPAADASSSDHVPDEPSLRVAQEGSEWAVRHAISEAIESFQLPYRLMVDFRTNVADGNVAFELKLTPSDVFPAEYYPADYPTAAPLASTRTSRRQLASAYALRVAMLLAACAFRTTPKIKHVWVAGIHESPTRHDCYFSVDFDRWRFAKVDLENVDDLERVMHAFCPVMRLEEGFLRPVQQSFALSEERFCPRRRYESVSLSARHLARPLAEALGTDHVSGLAIDEADKREAVANDILRRLVDPSDKHATEHNVQAILEIAADDPDPSVRSAAERTVTALAQGTIADDPFAVVEEFVSGDELSRACKEAYQALQNQNPDEALAVLSEVLDPIYAAGRYDDTSTVEWRYFDDFVDRALYNRLREFPERSLVLVPEGYFEAHSLAVMVLLHLNRVEEAVAHARELVRIAPLDARAHLQLVRALENNDELVEAADQLRELLRVAHDPQSVGTAYYRMAYFQWLAGNVLVARACYAAALRFIPAAAPQISMEIATLAFQTGSMGSSDLERTLSPQEVTDLLRAHDIPEAPTSEISDVFLECARASVDAEVFPVARNFLSTMTAFAPDDVLVGLMRSLEDAPDSL